MVRVNSIKKKKILRTIIILWKLSLRKKQEQDIEGEQVIFISVIIIILKILKDINRIKLWKRIGIKERYLGMEHKVV